jgi:RNA polymerase sigma-70 factor (ECF subfamily)
VNPAQSRLIRFPEIRKREDSYAPAELREDARLLAAIAGGDEPALELLYQRRSRLIYSLLTRMLGGETEAQEVTQDVFVQIWRKANQYDALRGTPTGWIIMIARGLALDRLRSRARRATTTAEYERQAGALALEDASGFRQMQQDELAAACARALHNLPETQKRAVQLAFMRGWTHEEISSAEGQPLGTIKARIRRALITLRKALKGHHD